MSIANYAVLKQHFDKLIKGGHPTSSGLEPIRDTYETSFNTKINLYDVYKSRIGVSTNPIGSIVSLVGPEADLTTGIMLSNNEIVCVNQFPSDILRGLDSSDTWYIRYVYDAISSIMSMDRFNLPDSMALDNPYITMIKALPLYFTFYHVKESAPLLMDASESAFKDIIEKYVVYGDDVATLYDSLNTRKYTQDFETAYAILTVNNSIELFR